MSAISIATSYVWMCRAVIVSMYLDNDSVCTAGCDGSDGLLCLFKLLVKEQYVEGYISLHSPLVQIFHDLPVTEARSVPLV